MNPITVFKDVANRIQIGDALAGVKAQAHADAADSAHLTAARFASGRALEAQQLDAAYDREERFSLEAEQERASMERKKLEIEGENERARLNRIESSTNTHFDNAVKLKDYGSAQEYLSSVGRPDLLPSVKSYFDNAAASLSRKGFETAVAGAKTKVAIDALKKTPEFAQFGQEPQFVAAEAAAGEEGRRYSAGQAQKAAIQKRLEALANVRLSGKAPAALTPTQEAGLVARIAKTKSDMVWADDETKQLLEAEVGELEGILARGRRPAVGVRPGVAAPMAGGSAMNPELLAELKKLIPKPKPKP